MFPPPAASQSQGVVEEPVLDSPTACTSISKVIDKKDSTQIAIKALVTRTHLKLAENATN